MTPAQRTVRRSLPWLLAGLSMIGPFSIDAVFPAFPLIGARFQVDDTALQQLVSAYLLTYAVMSLFHGAISDAIGRKPVIVTGMLVYALASVGAASSTSFAMLLACRSLQGMCAGAGLVVGRAVIRDSLEGPAAQRLMSQVMMIFGVAPVIAPMIGALLLPLGGWHGIFWLLAGFTLLLAVALLTLLDETHPPERRSRFAPRPLLAGYLAFARERSFWPLLVSSSVNFAGLFLYISSAPRIVRELLHLSAQGFPWLFVPVVIGLISGAWLSGRMAERCSAKRTVSLGYASMLLACVAHLLLALLFPQPRLPWSMLPLILHGIGVQLAFPTLTLLLLDRFPHHRGGISSVQAFASLLLCGFVAGVVSPLLSASMLQLALGASLLTVLGVLAWGWYHGVTREAVLPVSGADAAAVMAAEIAEPR
ncbi:multidrug transporter [Rhodanobacter sp. Root561]|jgi:DHA1 family bicyclomycin/chloramphenicol resistance-like MFS transporter|uniref:multidrug effflux MFS transporter n=1 Tax=Rhodanobacter sp. Root561 TaxID=1736560 RepID=UPI0006FD1B73|nr:multidrug effflux MFS transporter [Rhodanobacter sp. Root561]KQZ68391.1 multidrug transporter [Rhodanobacter sp. Root561]